MPSRDPLSVAIEQEVIEFNKNGDKCSSNSPIVAEGNVKVEDIPAQPELPSIF